MTDSTASRNQNREQDRDKMESNKAIYLTQEGILIMEKKALQSPVSVKESMTADVKISASLLQWIELVFQP